LVSNHPGTHYDGILALALHVLHFSKVFIGDDNAVQDLVDTLVNNISITSVHHVHLGVEFRSEVTKVITEYMMENRDKLSMMTTRESTLCIFGCIERFARDLQNSIHISLPKVGDRVMDHSYKHTIDDIDNTDEIWQEQHNEEN